MAGSQLAGEREREIGNHSIECVCARTKIH